MYHTANMDLFLDNLDKFTTGEYKCGIPHRAACYVCVSEEDFDFCLECIEKIEEYNNIMEEYDRVLLEADAREEFKRKQEILNEFGLNGYVLDTSYRFGESKSSILFYGVAKIGWHCICESILLPTRIFFNEDTDEEKIEIRYKSHGKIRSFICSPSELGDVRYVKKLTNHGILLCDAEILRLYLVSAVRANRGECIEIVKTTDHLGWYNNETGNTLEFVPYSDQYYYSGKLMKQKNLDRLLKPNGNFNVWKELMNSFRDEEHIVARIVLASGFASVLVKILGAQTFAVDIWGTQSGSGKSISLSNAISIWAKPGIDDGFIRKADSTKLSLEAYTSFLNNLPLGIDETSTESSRKKMAKFIYNICSEISHGALKTDGTLREQSNWKNCVILTGERPITSEQCFAGQLNRVIEIESPKHVFWNDSTRLMHHIKTLQQNYGVAGQRFVNKLKESGNVEYANTIYESLYDQINKIATGKQAESAAVILTADRLAAEWIFDDNVILTVEDISPFIKSDADVNTNERVHQIILEWIAENKGKFEEGRDKQYGRFSVREGKRTCEIVKKSLEDFLDSYSFSIIGYLSWARDTGKIYCEQDKTKNRKDVVVNFNGASVRMVCIYVEDE